ncbi:ABC transporter ATP-binding protein [Pseudoalteromonas luteoviolacea]|uniref:ABC transporter n=1 Tax=Pseudoalteromonas luteoviolacea H33 TaxID=1365251 RepID=A0A167DNX2_9GAMM|nr:ABC transporter ATP-binding protein [Pseudoalteromonas luteoviolacea]KZN49139.1 ABC transporter [Pseudoalteromonas luteoviolacea H33]KZN73569.1 ABC transporter [Pseudoalteromonas luteoviolacea H33-S]MBQ4875597.1 ABC transporter ATP-binding protein [Pseudoalteromonas luteoviolacea]MBQ4904632.1 ABC transporter ATP-binding protein [Pseudoalteromonas luteoviolacea]
MGVKLDVLDLEHTINLVNGEPLHLLKNISMSIEAGEHIAIVGASGSGKSTLLSLLAGLETLQKGKICYQKNLEVLSGVTGVSGFIFQHFHLLPELNALQNVALPLMLRGESTAQQRALEKLKLVNLEAQAKQPVTKLSGGEQQRVAIARALCNEPQVLFADEPTGNLDHKTAEQVFDLMLHGAKASGTTMVVVTHDLNLASKLDKTYKLENGELKL